MKPFVSRLSQSIREEIACVFNFLGGRVWGHRTSLPLHKPEPHIPLVPEIPLCADWLKKSPSELQWGYPLYKIKIVRVPLCNVRIPRLKSFSPL